MVAGSDSATSSSTKTKSRSQDDGLVKHQDHVNPLARFFFCWVIPLFWRGYHRELGSEDLDQALKDDLSQPLGDTLERNWLKEIEDAKRKGPKNKPRLLKAIFKTFIWGYLFDGFILFVQSMLCKPFIPVFLALMISQFVPGVDADLYKAKLYAAGLIGLSLMNVIIQHHVFLRTQQRGMRIRIACCSLLYRKLLRLSPTSLGHTTAGQLVNMMSNDVNRFDNVLMFLHFLWIAPFQICLMCYLIYLEVNLAAVVGVVSVTLQTLPLQSYLSRWSSKLRQKIALETDERVRIMNEIIRGIQVIKMYAWEKPFEQVVSIARARELKSIKCAAYIRGIYIGSMVFTERASLYVTLLAHSLMGYPISASAVFSLAQFYNKLQECLTFQYPNAMVMGAECMITIRRLQKFLLLEEHEECKELHKEKPMKSIDSNISVELNDVSAEWSCNSKTLSNISMKIQNGQLCAIIGSVGSGKSSLLHLLLKELAVKSGGMNVNGEISYSSQEPWLFVDTIRNNIIFGQPYDKTRYKQVIHACALNKDFDQFPRKDKTLVGERGISLSGGQRARINLARAVYREADVYLMDDPLSAVDACVGRHLFDECINSFLKGKTRILVTHQLHYLEAADLIIVLRNGQIEIVGTYAELASSGQDFTNLLADLQDGKADEEDDLSILNKSRVDPNTSLGTLKQGFDEDDELEPECEVIEDSGKGKIEMAIFWKYWKSGRNFGLVIFMLCAMFFGQFVTTSSDLWVTFWSNEQSKINKTPRTNYELFYTNDTLKSNGTVFEFNIWDKIGPLNTAEYLYIYTALIVACIVFVTGRSFLFFLTCIKSSRGLHDDMFHKLLRTKMRFFDTNPSGRILNRFSKDVGAMDELLPRAMIEVLQIALVFLSIMVLVSITNPWLVFPIIFVSGIFYFMLLIYLGAAQSIKRLESTTRSPVFSHMSASLHGVVTIRALKSQERLAREFDRRQDHHTSAWYSFIATGNSLGFWLDILCILFLIVVCYSFIYFKNDNASSGNVGLAVSQTLILMGMLQYGIRQTTEVVAQMTSVERVMQYTQLENEQNPEHELMETPKNWPNNGLIEFKNAYLSYSPLDPPVLKNLNFSIKDGWKIGIVGRTGAGKSSLISALFRLADIKGHIRISDMDTNFLDLHDIRSNISIIPQEPVLFSATLRYNLDPLNKYDDVTLWAALEAVELNDAIHTLEHHITEGGGNLSLGQRQLICLARAILRNNKILVLDEATANVDPQTDSFIQKTIREKFSHCTVLTIAHRLNTIMDSDRVLVMDGGNAVEFDHPHLLLHNKEGTFTKMVKETGPKMATNLSDVARNHYLKTPHIEIERM